MQETEHKTDLYKDTLLQRKELLLNVVTPNHTFVSHFKNYLSTKEDLDFMNTIKSREE